MPFVFYNRNGGMRWGEEKIVNSNDKIVLPDYGNIVNIVSIIYNGSIVTPSTSGLNSSSGFIYAVDNTNTYNVYAFANTSTNNTTSSTYTTTSGTYTINCTTGSDVTVNVLAVGGGGASAYNNGGGGGGGGVVMQQVTLPAGANTIIVSVGAGGLAPGSGTVNGNNTTVTFTGATSYNITAYGGGCGGSYSTNPTTGGSGGGAGSNGTMKGAFGNNNTANTNTFNYASPGANYSSGAGANGGGGGAGTPGSGTATNLNGGRGIQCTLPGITDFQPSFYSGLGNFGTLYWGGGGGGGNAGSTLGTSGGGGLGGGGGGSKNQNGTAGTGGGSAITTGTNGTVTVGSSGAPGSSGGAFTGGGAGGAGNNSSGGSGGSGIVVIAFPINVLAITSGPIYSASPSNLMLYYNFNDIPSSSMYVANYASGLPVYDAILSPSGIISTDNVNGISGTNGSLICSGSNSVTASLTSNSTFPFNLPAAATGNGFTHTCWIKLPSGAGFANGGIMYSMSTGNFYLWCTGTPGAASIVLKSNQYSWGDHAITSVNLTDYIWHFYVTTVACTNNSGACTETSYFDNTSIGSANYTTYPTTSASISEFNFNSWSGGNYPMTNILVDNFRHYNRVLTGPELTNLYTNKL